MRSPVRGRPRPRPVRSCRGSPRDRCGRRRAAHRRRGDAGSLGRSRGNRADHVREVVHSATSTTRVIERPTHPSRRASTPKRANRSIHGRDPQPFRLRGDIRDALESVALDPRAVLSRAHRPRGRPNSRTRSASLSPPRSFPCEAARTCPSSSARAGRRTCSQRDSPGPVRLGGERKQGCHLPRRIAVAGAPAS